CAPASTGGLSDDADQCGPDEGAAGRADADGCGELDADFSDGVGTDDAELLAESEDAGELPDCDADADLPDRQLAVAGTDADYVAEREHDAVAGKRGGLSAGPVTDYCGPLQHSTG